MGNTPDGVATVVASVAAGGATGLVAEVETETVVLLGARVAEAACVAGTGFDGVGTEVAALVATTGLAVAVPDGGALVVVLGALGEPLHAMLRSATAMKEPAKATSRTFTSHELARQRHHSWLATANRRACPS